MRHRSTHVRHFLVLFGLSAAGAAPLVGQGEGPPTRRGTDADTLHGTVVPDPYRWLERAEDSRVVEWVRRAGDATDAFVRDGVPYERIVERVRELSGRSGAYRLPQVGGEKLFFWEARRGAGGMSADLYVRDGDDPAGDARGLLQGTGIQAAALLDFRPSPSGEYVAVASRVNPGAPWLRWRVVRVADGAVLDEVLEGGLFPRTDLVWGRDDREIFYTRFDGPDSGDGPGLTNHVVRRHTLGTDVGADPLVFRPDSSRDWSLDLDRTADDRYLVISARIGNAIDAEVHVAGMTDRPAVVPLIQTPVASYVFVGARGDRFFFRTDLEAERGRMIAVDRADPSRFATVVRQTDDLLLGNSVWGGQPRPLIIGGRFVLPYQRDMRTYLQVRTLDGAAIGTIDTPAGGMLFAASGGNPVSGDPDRPTGYFRFIGITEPDAVYRFDVERLDVAPMLRPTLPFDPDRFVSELAFYESKDGTRVPMTLTYRRDVDPQSNRPVWLLVYGSGGFVMNPFFQSNFMAWLEMGGIHAIAHVRGGGAYGRSWQEAGNVANKQNGIDDYIAAADWMIEQGYTAPGRIVLNAVSAGGLITTAVTVQRPDLAGAVISDYPVTDIVRLTSGRFGGDWTPEYGDPNDPAQFRAMFAYSPYHQIRPGRCYPPTLVLTSEADELASHSYKFVAAAHHAQSCDRPVLLQVAWGSPHAGYGSREHPPFETHAEQIAFLIKVMGLDVGELVGREDY